MVEIYWNPSIEKLIKGIGEKGLSMSWLHSKSEKHYNYFNNFLSIPTIILSTITATIGGTFAGDKIFSYSTSFISIIVSILSTLNSYFVFAKRAEAHRITSIQYSKLFLQINIELALPRDKRLNVKEFLRNVSEQLQRLNEIQPQIPDSIITLYNKHFKDEPNTIEKPTIVNGLYEIKICLDDLETSTETPSQKPSEPRLCKHK